MWMGTAREQNSKKQCNGGNIMEAFSRSELLFGKDGMHRLQRAHVAVVGIGGVGCALTEALVRGGIGALNIVDHDVIDITNINRQLIATRRNVGKSKAACMRDRIYEINPDCRVYIYEMFYAEQTQAALDLKGIDYVADAIDSIKSKILLIQNAYEAGTPIISAMGAGNKLDPARFQIADLYETRVCPVARILRRELKKRNIEKLNVVYSDEQPIQAAGEGEMTAHAAPGSASFVPPVMGYIMAGKIIRDIAMGKTE